MKEVTWLDDVEEHNYPAALSYLSLIYSDDKAGKFVEQLRRAPLTQFKAKDVFRASQLSILGVSNSRVERDREKIQKGIGLSPLLLVRDEALGKVVIADGYHRMCALYGFNEDVWIHCKIV
jgi:hypothetical protein